MTEIRIQNPNSILKKIPIMIASLNPGILRFICNLLLGIWIWEMRVLESRSQILGILVHFRHFSHFYLGINRW